MIEGMTIGHLKARIAEAEERGVVTDDSLVVMYVPLTDGMITPLAFVDPDDMYVSEENHTTGELLSWDNDTCDGTEDYAAWREHARSQHAGVPCLVVYGCR